MKPGREQLHINPGVRIYLTYEELKQAQNQPAKGQQAGIYLTYEELKPSNSNVKDAGLIGIYLTYEELKHVNPMPASTRA